MASTDKGLGWSICGRTVRDLLVGAGASAGKTRMALVYIIIIGLIHDEVKIPFHFVVVHPNKALHAQDEDQFKAVETLIAAYDVTLERVSSFSEAEKLINPTTRVICDEWDRLAIDLYESFTLYQKSYG